MITEFQQKIYKLVESIPCGRVATYATVARRAGDGRAARAVGNALNKNPFRGVPCHRVIRSNGHVGGFARGTQAKINLLENEGIKIINQKVDPEFIIV